MNGLLTKIPYGIDGDLIDWPVWADHVEAIIEHVQYGQTLIMIQGGVIICLLVRIIMLTARKSN